MNLLGSFRQYLDDNYKNNVIDFSLRVQLTSDGLQFYIHPSGRDGDTMEFLVSEVIAPTPLYSSIGAVSMRGDKRVMLTQYCRMHDETYNADEGCSYSEEHSKTQLPKQSKNK